MELTSGPFLVLLTLAAVAATVACVRLLPRTAGRGARQVLARTGLVAGAELAMMLAILALVNSSFEFFGSWADLLGTDRSRPGVVTGRSAPRSLPPAVSPRPSSDPLIRVPAGQGRLDSIVVHGLRTGLAAPAYVYLPPEYTAPAYRRRRLPVVLILTSGTRALITGLHLPELVAAQVAAHRVRPAVYVMLDPPGCVDVPGGRQAGTFLAQDVPAAIAAAYRVAPDAPGWGVIGDSGGGYCAAALALEHSDRFTAAASAAPAFTAPEGDLYGGSAAIRDENDLVWRLEHRPPPPADLLVLLGGGNDEAARRLLAPARPPLRSRTLTLTGDGALPTWRRDLPAVLGWLDRRLSPES